MLKLGISVYPDIQSFDEIRNYIELAGRYGFTRVFSSMWSVEGTKEEILDYFRQFIQVSHENHMEVDLDVNPDLFEKLGASYDDVSVFADLGVDILRMDMAYDIEKSVILINNPYDILIEFNASVVSEGYIDALRKAGAGDKRILACHNFYPQRYTGMKWKTYLDNNAALKKDGVEVAAFITSQNENTCGVWGAICGLPTVERMRDLPLDVQIRTMMAAGNIDSLLIGNACASEEELRSAPEILKEIEADDRNPIVAMMMKMGANKEMFYPQKKIRVSLDEKITDTEKEILLGFFPHSDVGDSSEWIWRSRMPRFLRKQVPARKEECEYFEPGTVLMVNDNYDHYAGEVQIALLPLVNDGTRNRIGRLEDEEMEILKLVKDREVVVFLEK